MKNIKKLCAMLVGVIVVAMPLLLSGCHTVTGVGQDIQAGGRAITHAGGK